MSGARVEKDKECDICDIAITERVKRFRSQLRSGKPEFPRCTSQSESTRTDGSPVMTDCGTSGRPRAIRSSNANERDLKQR